MFIYNSSSIKNGGFFKTLKEVLTNKSYDQVLKYCEAMQTEIKKENLEAMVKIRQSYKEQESSDNNITKNLNTMFYSAKHIFPEIFKDGLVDVAIGYNPCIDYSNGLMSVYYIFRCKSKCFIVSKEEIDQHTFNYLKAI